jgi:RNA polymerase sigma-70 factor (ECF subfamily)
MDSHQTASEVAAQKPVSFDAFERVYQANVDLVYSYAAARLGGSEAEDVTSEVFHAALVAWQDRKRTQITTAWLMAVTKNKVIDRWRKAERRKAKAHLLSFPQPSEWPDAWTDPHHREHVVDCLNRLGSGDRLLLILRHVDGMAVRDIAEEAGRTVTAVESQLARARRTFRRHYEQMEARDGA